MSKRNALGRGLNALLSDSKSTPEDKLDVDINSPKKETAEPAKGIAEIAITEIEVNPYQPRTHFDQEALQELAESIKVHGIIQPITVRKLTNKQYQLISGERRFQASKLAGLEKLPAYIREADDQQMLEMALIENIQRENLNAIEVALSYQRLLTECNLKQEELGTRVGKNRATITNYLRLLKLPPDIQIAVRDNKISMGHARALINVESADRQLFLFSKIIRQDLSVRDVEKLVRELANKSNSSDADTVAAPPREITQLQSKLSSHFGTRIVVKSDGKKGEIKIPFLSVEDLNRILDILKMQ